MVTKIIFRTNECSLFSLHRRSYSRRHYLWVLWKYSVKSMHSFLKGIFSPCWMNFYCIWHTHFGDGHRCVGKPNRHLLRWVSIKKVHGLSLYIWVFVQLMFNFTFMLLSFLFWPFKFNTSRLLGKSLRSLSVTPEKLLSSELRGGRLVGGSHANFIPNKMSIFKYFCAPLFIFSSDLHNLSTLITLTPSDLILNLVCFYPHSLAKAISYPTRQNVQLLS